MDARLKRQIAREWLIFLCCIVVGGAVVPVVIAVLFPIKLGLFYEAVFSNANRDQGAAWLVILGPYVLVQILRSIAWAYRILKANPS